MFIVGNEMMNVLPSIANEDAAPAIIGESMALRLVATRHHALPRRKETILRHSVGRHSSRRLLSSKTPAGRDLPATELHPRNSFLNTAVASTYVLGLFRRVQARNPLNDGHAPEALSDHLVVNVTTRPHINPPRIDCRCCYIGKMEGRRNG